MLRRPWLLVAIAACTWSACTTKAPGPPPIILISMDTLRADHLGAYGNTDGLTPNLDRFAQESIVFDNAYSQAIRTAPSHASIFTSLYPSEQTSPGDQPELMPDHATMAEMFSASGYQTAAFVGGGDLSPHRRLGRGFQTYRSSPDFGSLYHTTPLAMRWLDQADLAKPYLLFVHGYDAHSTYLKPTPFGYLHADLGYEGQGQVAAQTATERIIGGFIYPDFDGLLHAQLGLLRPWSAASSDEVSKFLSPEERAIPVTERDQEFVGQIYSGAVSYGDAMFGNLMADLETRGQLKRAIVMVMSDHGEQLGEHGIFGHCCGIGDEETHTVLMVRMPEKALGGTHVSGFVEMVDILPTLAEMGSVRPPAEIVGQSFAAALRGEPFSGREFAHSEGGEVFRVVSVRGASGRLTYGGLPASSPYLADMVESARLDSAGFTGVERPGREILRGEMVRWLRTLRPPPFAEDQPLPESLRKSLREHGYFDVDK